MHHTDWVVSPRAAAIGRAHALPRTCTSSMWMDWRRRKPHLVQLRQKPVEAVEPPLPPFRERPGRYYDRAWAARSPTLHRGGNRFHRMRFLATWRARGGVGGSGREGGKCCWPIGNRWAAVGGEDRRDQDKRCWQRDRWLPRLYDRAEPPTKPIFLFKKINCVALSEFDYTSHFHSI